MTRVPHEPLTPEERELADRLARLGAPGGPSSALDARILAAAHDAVAGDGARRARRTRWPVAMGVAATLVLAIGIAWQLRPAQDTARTYSEAPVAAPAASAPPSEAAKLPAAGVVADEVAPMPVPPPEVAAETVPRAPEDATGTEARTAFRRQADQAMRESAAAEDRRDDEAPEPAARHARDQADAASRAPASGQRAPEERASAERTPDESAAEVPVRGQPVSKPPSSNEAAPQVQTKQAAAVREGRARSDAVRTEAATLSAPPPPPAPAAPPAEMVFDVPAPATAPASATAPAAAAQAPVAGSAAKRTTSAPRSDATAPVRIETAAAARGLERDNAGFTDQVLDEQPPATADSPQVQRAWLQRIRELLADGDTEGARASLAEFKRRYPRYALPDDLREFAPPPSPSP